MAHSQVIEEESGSCRGWVHPHNGYYAGSFATTDAIHSGRGTAAARHLQAVAEPHRHTMTAAAGPVTWREAA